MLQDGIHHLQSIFHIDMASSAYVNNVVPIKLWLDNGAKARQKAFENACKVDEILHDREMKVNLVWFKLNLLLSSIFIYIYNSIR